MLFHLSLAFLVMAQVASTRYVMYLTGQHPVVPEWRLVKDITHVTLAFVDSKLLNPGSLPLDTKKARRMFSRGTAVMIAIGGWGDTKGFSEAAATVRSRKRYAHDVKLMIEHTGADGVDIDWEYPGGNGEDYKRTPNSEKAWEIEAYPELLSEIRSALGPKKLISAAVPGLPRDMLAFTETTITNINASVDFFNIMTYDMMNRRDKITKHHTGIELSLQAIDTYEELGIPTEKMNLGFAFYIKWYKTDPKGGCNKNPIGCKTVLMEDPSTGADLGQAGAFSWHDTVPKQLSVSYEKAMAHGEYDPEHGGHYYWDAEKNIWWSWDTPDVIVKKLPEIMEKKQLGGVFAWALGEDANDFSHLKALTAVMEEYSRLRDESSASDYEALPRWQIKKEWALNETVALMLALALALTCVVCGVFRF